jgi:UDP-N-acetylglucosamine 1-carboxyvinyltransferase
MSEVVIRHDGRPLRGSVRLDGGKHAFAHSLGCAALADHMVVRDAPDHIDAIALRSALALVFTRVDYDRDRRVVTATAPRSVDVATVDAGLASRSRSLFCLLPALLTRARRVVVAAPPRGCQIGERPSEWYLDVLRRFGVLVERTGSATVLSWPRRRPADIEFPYPTMTGTVVAVAAAAATPGRSAIRGASVEPSCVEQLACLSAMGAGASGELPEVVIDGRTQYPAIDWTTAPDRIHAVTLLVAGLLTRGEVTVAGNGPLRIPRFVEFLHDAGARVRDGGSTLTAGYPERGALSGVRLPAGSEPWFSSDWAPFAALLLATRAAGASRISDDVFLDRFQFVANLEPLGLRGIRLQPGVAGTRPATFAEIDGKPDAVLRGGDLGHCADIRGSAALVLAALVADGPCVMRDDLHLRRGYTDLPGTLAALGVSIRQTRQTEVSA